MLKYIIQLPTNKFVKNGKNDTSKLSQAKKFDNYTAAVNFLRTLCASSTVIKKIIIGDAYDI